MKLPPAPPGAFEPEALEFRGADGVETKLMHFPELSQVAQHVHAYDHTTFVFGAADLWADGKHLGHYENTGVTIKAGIQHMICTTKRDTWILCIHNVMRTGEIEVLSEV